MVDDDVLFCDNHVLGVCKPPGLVVQGALPGAPSLLDEAKAWVAARYRKTGNVFLGVVHRLDRPAAGVVALARTSKAASRLSAQFRDRTVEKLYFAVVEGKLPAPAGSLRDRLCFIDGRATVAPASSPSAGPSAELDYEVLGERSGTSFVRVRLGTGRKHQIRAQLAAVGCPVVGDGEHGARRSLLVDTPGGRVRAVALLAWRLTLEHPTLGTPLALEAPVPPWWPWEGYSSTGTSRTASRPTK